MFVSQFTALLWPPNPKYFTITNDLDQFKAHLWRKHSKMWQWHNPKQYNPEFYYLILHKVRSDSDFTASVRELYNVEKRELAKDLSGYIHDRPHCNSQGFCLLALVVKDLLLHSSMSFQAICQMMQTMKIVMQKLERIVVSRFPDVYCYKVVSFRLLKWKFLTTES